MSVLVFAESTGDKCRKAAFEAVTFGKKTAELLGKECIALTISTPSNGSDLGIYGAQKVFDVPLSWTHFDNKAYAQIIADVATSLGATTVVLSHSARGKALAGRLAVRLNAGIASAANEVPNVDDGLVVKRSVYSGKAIASIKLTSEKNIISVQSNSIPLDKSGTAVSVAKMDIAAPSSDIKVEVIESKSDTIPLPEAELVVSGGRGFKGPENWGILEELASELGAATACSRPVADSDWRPHHEHVGQTGVAIRPNLYIAIGISGAIQHLGGVNNSKTIVVINKDPEAPFFKAADYGVVGDLFEVVPRLTEAVKKFKASSK